MQAHVSFFFKIFFYCSVLLSILGAFIVCGTFYDCAIYQPKLRRITQPKVITSYGSSTPPTTFASAGPTPYQEPSRDGSPPLDTRSLPTTLRVSEYTPLLNQPTEINSYPTEPAEAKSEVTEGQGQMIRSLSALFLCPEMDP